MEEAGADVPLLEGGELDGKRFGHLLVVGVEGDAEALAQEGLGRVLDEADQVVELDGVGALGGEGAGQERLGGGLALALVGGQGPGAVEGDGVEAPGPVADKGLLAGGEVAGVEGLEGVLDDDPLPGLLGGVALGGRTVRSMTSRSSPTGTAGGRSVLVRSSRPV